MSLPTREEINIHDSLDERNACAHFLGKTLKQAEELFRENSIDYQEDLMWMGIGAFKYYVQAFISYIQSKESAGDSDAINCFAGLLEFRVEREQENLNPIAQQLANACRYIISHYDRFDVTTEIYGDLRARYEGLIQKLL